jgi:hypothetical protein
MSKRFTYIGDYSVTEHKDGTASVSRDIDGDEVIIARCSDFDSAVTEGFRQAAKARAGVA